jgi:type IV secretion system protein VirB1
MLMQFATATILSLAAQCAPSVAPATVAAVVHTESRGWQFALNVNGLTRQPARVSNANDAIRIARYYVSQGYSVDLGLGQINSRNMKGLGLTWDTVFDPCTNVAAAGAVLAGNYRSVRTGLHPQTALRVALSMYNTGSQSRGFRNGYVSRVVGNAGVSDGVTPIPIALTRSTGTSPALSDGERAEPSLLAALVQENTSVPGQPKAAPPPPPPSWDVFAKAEYERAKFAQTGED